MSEGGRVEAVTFDFFNTLVALREGRGRGRLLVEYVAGLGYRPGPWEHDILYRLFEHHRVDYAPALDPQVHGEYLGRLAYRAFRELGVSLSEEEAAGYAEDVWEILGPSCLEVFPDVVPALEALKGLGLPIAVISNWQCGLDHFVSELGLAPYMDQVIGSADFGVAKPDPGIFLEASRLLDVHLSNVLHVGDTLEDDYRGGSAAGCRVVLLQRRRDGRAEADRVIAGLDELLRLPELSGGSVTGV